MADLGPNYNAELINTIGGISFDIKDVIFIGGCETIVTATADRIIRIWQCRDGGKFWPSTYELLSSPASCLLYNPEDRHLFAGSENGTICEYYVQEDFNALQHVRDYLHTATIIDLANVTDCNLIISTWGKEVAMDNIKTGRCDGNFQLKSFATCMVYDASKRRIFVGDVSCAITILDIAFDDRMPYCQLVNVLRKHSMGVTSLAWDCTRSRLFSGSDDCSVMIWDITDREQFSYVLQGHTKPVSAVCFWANGRSPIEPDSPGLVISGGLDGLLVFWFMSVTRKNPASWSQSDICEQCGSPFWSLSSLWYTKRFLGRRQHHCRRCGKAFCGECCKTFMPLPLAGFEKDVRMCEGCKDCLQDREKQRLALTVSTGKPVLRVKLDAGRNILITVGKDRVIRLWRLTSMAVAKPLTQNSSQKQP